MEHLLKNKSTIVKVALDKRMVIIEILILKINCIQLLYSLPLPIIQVLFYASCREKLYVFSTHPAIIESSP
ncbi:MAG: hypothetical protein WCL06_00530 [Bacteroidota bacterium]